MVFFELLPRNQTSNSDVYCYQLNKLNAAVKEKRPEFVNREGVIFHDDNATTHTSLATRQKLLRLGWEVSSTCFKDCYDYIEFRCNNMNKCNKTLAFPIFKQYYTKFPPIIMIYSNEKSLSVVAFNICSVTTLLKKHNLKFRCVIEKSFRYMYLKLKLDCILDLR